MRLFLKYLLPPFPFTVLQLYNNLGGGEWAQFLHREDKFTDFNKVREEIEAETERECPNKVNIAGYNFLLL